MTLQTEICRLPIDTCPNDQELGSSLRDPRQDMSKEPTSGNVRDRFGMTPADWDRLRVLTDEEITAAALADPDAQPLTNEQPAQMRRPALVKLVRQRLRLGQDSFATLYGVPLDTLRAWERHEAEPSQAETAYLRLIEREPERAKLVPVSS